MWYIAVLLLTWLAVPAWPATALPQRAAKPLPSTTLTLTVTDGRGEPIEGVEIAAIGTVSRDGTTDASGVARFVGVRAGTYRVLFTRKGYITFEKEIAWRVGQPAIDVSVMLNDAEPEPAPPEPPPPPPPPPPGVARSLSLPDFIEQNFISNREAQKTSSLGCSGLAEGTLWQIREPWLDQQYPDSDLMLYVVGGEGSLRLDARTVPLAAGTFVVVPRGTTYGLSRSGRNPLFVLAVIAGVPCP